MLWNSNVNRLPEEQQFNPCRSVSGGPCVLRRGGPHWGPEISVSRAPVHKRTYLVDDETGGKLLKSPSPTDNVTPIVSRLLFCINLRLCSRCLLRFVTGG